MDDHDSYRGAWGVYPFLPSGNILVSDMQYGLYVLENTGFNTVNDENKNLCLSPNPAYNTIQIELPENEITLDLFIYDLKGQIIDQKQISNGNNILSVVSLDHGIYIVQAQGEKTLYQQKFIVQ